MTSTQETWTPEKVAARFQKIVVEQLGVAETDVKPDAAFANDLGADSLDDIELLMACEEEFDIEIPDDVVDRMQTVNDAVTYLVGRLVKPS